MAFQTHKLPNGLEIIGETLPTARSASVGFFVMTGSRDEVGPETGVSHFLEHMMFKGTPRRTALQVNLDFDKIGANYNAYTSEETTVYYASLLPEHLADGVDILADILRPSLRDEDFTTEKEVILEEIKMYEDQPGSMAWDYAKQIHFGSHPLGQSILGTMESVAALTRDQMADYFTRRYSPSNIVVAVSGNIDWPKFVELVEGKCGHWTNTPFPPRRLDDSPGAPGLKFVTKPNSTQQHFLFLSRGPSAENRLRYEASVLSMAIGDDSGSRIYWELVDPGLVESAGASTDQSQGTGLALAMFSSDTEKASENLAKMQRIFSDVQKNNITAEELTKAKNKIASRIVRGNERPMGRMRSIAGAWIYNREYANVDREMNRFDEVNLDTIRRYLDEFPIDQPTIVAYGPMTRL
ncbi:MAG: M16 family metallopeptidase [Fimbriiglobus sp.]